MNQWQPYNWPDLTGDPWRDWVNQALSRIAQALSTLAPDDVFTWGDSTGSDWPIIAGEDDGHSPGYDGGSGSGPDGGGASGNAPGPPPADPMRPWKLLGSPRHAGDRDIQMMASKVTTVPGMILRGVSIPDECEEPVGGDTGTAWRMEAGTVMFLPTGTGRVVAYEITAVNDGGASCDMEACLGTGTTDPGYSYSAMLPLNAGDTPVVGDRVTVVTLRDATRRFFSGNAATGTYATPATVGTTAETEAAQGDTWDRTSPAGGTDGVTVTMQTRSAYAAAGGETLYAYYRDLTFDALGALATVSAETRVMIDTPEACS